MICFRMFMITQFWDILLNDGGSNPPTKNTVCSELLFCYISFRKFSWILEWHFSQPNIFICRIVPEQHRGRDGEIGKKRYSVRYRKQPKYSFLLFSDQMVIRYNAKDQKFLFLTPRSQSPVSPSRGWQKKAKERQARMQDTAQWATTETETPKRSSWRQQKPCWRKCRWKSLPIITKSPRPPEKTELQRDTDGCWDTPLNLREEDVNITERLMLKEWGFPLSSHDLTNQMKNYLESLGRSTGFVNNLPRPDFVRGFLKCYPQLTVMWANMIKRGRAALTQEEVNQFFDWYEKVVAGIPLENMFNYEETNLHDNLGQIYNPLIS